MRARRENLKASKSYSKLFLRDKFFRRCCCSVSFESIYTLKRIVSEIYFPINDQVTSAIKCSAII